MDLKNVQDNFENLLSNVPSDCLADFFGWIQRKYLVAECGGEAPAIASHRLYQISVDIKNKVPLEAVLPTETISIPSTGHNSDCDPRNTVHVDAFLYDQVDIDDLVNEKKLHQHYCLDCGSRNIGQLTFISHSASKRRIEFIFTAFLKRIDFSNKTILDVGSRLGGMLYGAYLFTNAKQIIGIEINKELCDIQNEIIDKYSMRDRIKVINNDVSSCSEIVKSADIIILNNVFEFFENKSKQVNDWIFLKNNIKSGTILVTIPSLKDTILNLPESGIILDNWVSKREITDPLLAMSVQDQDELSEICIYQVL